MDQGYTVFVHLVGQNDIRAGERCTYPGLGRFPTSLWPEGATHFPVDRYHTYKIILQSKLAVARAALAVLERVAPNDALRIRRQCLDGLLIDNSSDLEYIISDDSQLPHVMTPRAEEKMSHEGG